MTQLTEPLALPVYRPGVPLMIGPPTEPARSRSPKARRRVVSVGITWVTLMDWRRDIVVRARLEAATPYSLTASSSAFFPSGVRDASAKTS